MMKHSNFDVLLGMRLREERLKKKMSMEEVGEKFGCTRQMISVFELGKSPLTVVQLKKLCSIYGISYSDVLNEIPDVD